MTNPAEPILFDCRSSNSNNSSSDSQGNGDRNNRHSQYNHARNCNTDSAGHYEDDDRAPEVSRSSLADLVSVILMLVMNMHHVLSSSVYACSFAVEQFCSKPCLSHSACLVSYSGQQDRRRPNMKVTASLMMINL
jgi:hypothetical protein